MCSRLELIENEWMQWNFVLPRLPYPELKKHLISVAAEYRTFINPRILAHSALHQYQYERCPSFPKCDLRTHPK